MPTVPSQAPPPTPDNIASVQQSLTNMLAFNKVTRTFAALHLPNAYNLLSQVDNQDVLAEIGLNMLEGAFWAVGSNFGMAGNFAASFLSGMAASWSSNPPPDLAGSYSDLDTAILQTSFAVDAQLGIYYRHTAEHWNDSFSYNNTTFTLAGIATQPFPAAGEKGYVTMETAASKGMDQSIWTYLLKAKFQITQWQSPNAIFIDGQQNTPPTAWLTMFYQRNPAYFANYVWYSTTGCGAKHGWNITEYSLGIAPTNGADNAITQAAASYLMTDFDPAKPSTTSGLFTREYVFINLGLKLEGWFQPNNPEVPGFAAKPEGQPFAQSGEPAIASPASIPPVPALSRAYLRAMKEGKTLTHLIATEGRQSVEARILAQAKIDPIFAADLKMRPRQTLEVFLGVLIAEPIKLSVIVEDSLTFGIVIPQQQS